MASVLQGGQRHCVRVIELAGHCRRTAYCEDWRNAKDLNFKTSVLKFAFKTTDLYE
jgi:hypothetical protein